MHPGAVQPWDPWMCWVSWVSPPAPCRWHPLSSELIRSREKPPGFAFLAGITLTGACNLPSDKRCWIMQDSANLRALGS